MLSLQERLDNVKKEHERLTLVLGTLKQQTLTTEQQLAQLQGSYAVLNELIQEAKNADEGNK